MVKKNKHGTRPLTRWLIMQAFIIVVASVVASLVVVTVYNHFTLPNEPTDPIIGIGMLFPMGVVTGTLFYFFSKKMNENTRKLMNAIDEVSSGNYCYKLDPTNGPFQLIFQDFNKMTEELAGVDKLRNDFINKFSHEFKTPIASISGFADLILRSNINLEDERQYLEIILAESRRLAALSTDSLFLSSLESQQIIVDKKQYSLDEQLKQVVILLSPQWTEKKIQVDLDLPRILYFGNAELMQHVWINLLNNAIKYTPNGGTITISGKKEKNRNRVSFRDSGIGMNSDEIANIFNKYYQSNPNDNGHGLGLGLTIVHRIVSLEGGQITVTSEKENGSTFAVYLPDNTY